MVHYFVCRMHCFGQHDLVPKDKVMYKSTFPPWGLPQYPVKPAVHTAPQITHQTVPGIKQLKNP